MHYRRFESQDRMPVYRLFRETVWDLMMQQGMMSPDEAPELDEYFRQQQGLYLHLEACASEDWVAEDDDNNLVGWARSIERDNHLQLTHFFVSSATQGSGVGRGLLDRAFPLGRGEQRSIIATIYPPALSLYLRYDVNFQSMALTVYGTPQRREIETDLEIRQAAPSSQTRDQVIRIEKSVLGYERPSEVEYFMHRQPTFLFYREGELAGYAFGYTEESTGPAAALSAGDFPVLVQQIEHSAADADAETLYLVIPACASLAVRYLLTQGYRIDPFHEVLLARHPTMQFDRYLISQSSFVW